MHGIGRTSQRVIVGGEGSWLIDESSRRILDFTSGIGVVNLGHCHPRIIQAAKDQLNKLVHCQMSVAYGEQTNVKLPAKLMKVLHGFDTFFFGSTGAEAVELATRIAKQVTRRPNIIVFQGGFHGRSVATSSMSTAKTIYRHHPGPLMPNVLVAPAPYWHQLPQQLSREQGIDYCLEQLELILQQQTHPLDCAAMIIEPVLGEGGYVVMPDRFLVGVREISKRHDILLILDEVQSGYGRTGKFLASEYSGITADIVVLSKAIANGLPLSCVASSSHITDRTLPGTLGATFGGNQVACAAASAVLDVFQEENILGKCQLAGEHLFSLLQQLALQGYPIAEVRGRGLMIGMEFAPDCPPGTARRVVEELEQEGMLLLPCSTFETLRFIPPLTVTTGEIELAVTKLEVALQKVLGRAPTPPA